MVKLWLKLRTSDQGHLLLRNESGQVVHLTHVCVYHQAVKALYSI